jgi:hypothetical protein
VAVLSTEAEATDRLVGDQVLAYGTAAWDAWFAGRTDALVDQLGRQGARVALVLTSCAAGRPDVDAHLGELFVAAARRHPSVATTVDLTHLDCPGGRFAPGVAAVGRRLLVAQLGLGER